MMNGTVLATEVLAAIGGEVPEQRRAAFEAFCCAIVAHIKANAVVTGTAAAVPLAGGTAPVYGAIDAPTP